MLRLHKNCQFGTATSDHRLIWSQGVPALCRRATEDIAFLIRLHPPCSDSFVCLGSHPSLANHADGTVEVVVAIPKLLFQAVPFMQSFQTRFEAVVLLVLGGTLVLPIARRPLLKL